MFELQKSRNSPTIGVVLIIALMAWAAFGQTQSTIQVRELPTNQTIEAEMTGAETHRYISDLRANWR